MKFNLDQLISFGYYAKKNNETPMRVNYHNWVKENKIKNGIDLEKIEKKIDQVLKEETTESLMEWLELKRTINSFKKLVKSKE